LLNLASNLNKNPDDGKSVNPEVADSPAGIGNLGQLRGKRQWPVDFPGWNLQLPPAGNALWLTASPVADEQTGRFC
jgi:hypothetical protein